MANAAYIIIASGFIAIAIVVHLLRRYDVDWIIKSLQPLDLRVLGEIAEGKRFGVGRDRFVRLSSRGFIANDQWGGCRITLKGRYADLVLGARAAPRGDNEHER